MDTRGTPPSGKFWTKRKILLLLAAGAGLVCYTLPEHLQGPCHLCAKLLGVAVGAP